MSETTALDRVKVERDELEQKIEKTFKSSWKSKER